MGGVRGFDGNKQLVGRKRHILVDTEGFLLAVVVHAASIPDRKGGQQVLEAAGDAFPRLQHIWADQGYTGTLQRWAAQEHGWSVQVVYPTWRQLQRYAPGLLPDGDYAKRFHVVPRRWVVECTFSWFGRQRRLSKDYERLASSTAALLYLAGIRLLLTRLAQEEK
jgi:putative transposase